jgi:hypothetical protein
MWMKVKASRRFRQCLNSKELIIERRNINQQALDKALWLVVTYGDNVQFTEPRTGVNQYE